MTADSLTIDRYRLFDEVGTGGMARVHLAKLRGAAGFARVVAVKRMHPHLAAEPALRAMFIDEARLSVRIEHPHVVRTLDVLQHEGGVALVMEYVLGESLSRALRGADGPVALPIAVAIMKDVLSGLHAAHEARDVDGRPLGIVHRDVSPKNILLGKDGAARLIDFGVAKATRRLAVTATGDTKGTRAYMAPEQLAAGAVSRATDVYAAAIVLREMVGEDAPPLARVLERALAQRSGDRHPTALAFAEELALATTPASQVEVARWLERVAGDAIELAEERLARIEREVDPESEPAPLGIPTRAPSPARARWLAIPAVIAALLLALGVRSWLMRAAPSRPVTAALVTTPPEPEPTVPAVAPLSAAPEPPPSAPAKTPARRPTPRPGCNPPFAIDEAGHKIFNPKCF